MLAQLLHASGVYFGAESELMEPSHDNPEGFWEHVGFVSLNDEILRHFGGSWDLPPIVPAFEPDHSVFQDFREKARGLIEGMGPSRHWGWKDPRNCLTLPFWRQLIPDMRVVVIVRHPFEVAASLHARNGFSHTLGYHLWHTYNERVLAATASDTILVTDYNSFFYDPETEVARILEHLRIPAPQSHSELSALVSTGHRHHYATRGEVARANIPASTLELYAAMLARSSPHQASEIRVPPKRTHDRPRAPSKDRAVVDPEVADLRQQLAERTAWAERLDDERAERTAWAQAADREKAEACAALARLQQEFEERTAWALKLSDEVEQARAIIAQLQTELHNMSLLQNGGSAPLP